MKKITLLTLLMVSGIGFSQIKSTGVVAINSNMTARIDLNQTTSLVTLTITNPASSWFGLGFKSAVGTSGDGMPALVDCVVMRTAIELSDSQTRTTGTGNPNIDATQNWTIISNVDAGTVKTVVATRAFDTGDLADYVFNYNDSSINLIFASPASGNFELVYHGGGTLRGFVNVPFTSLGLEDFSLNATSIYPNPANGSFNVQTKTNLDQINIYSQTGQFVKTINVADKSDKVEVNVKGLSTGIYLIELKNATEKSWKKVIVE